MALDPTLTVDQALQMTDAQADGFAAGDWCYAANVLAQEVERAKPVVAKASAYRMIETGELHRALGLGAVLPSEIAKARQALDDALAEYESSRSTNSQPQADA